MLSIDYYNSIFNTWILYYGIFCQKTGIICVRAQYSLLSSIFYYMYLYMDVDILLDLVAEDKYLHGIVYNVDAIRTKLLFAPNRFTLSKN